MTTLCTEEEIATLVHSFYAKVRSDPVLGPIFNSQISDWNHHLDKLVSFWSSILLRTGRFTGAPMPKHAAMPGLTAALFEHWLALFHETTQAQPNQAMGTAAYAAAQRIAQSLWAGYQASRDTAPQHLPIWPTPVRASPQHQG